MPCFPAAPGTLFLVADATVCRDMMLAAYPVVGWNHVQGNQAFPMLHTPADVGEGRRTAVQHPNGTVTDTSATGVYASAAAWLDSLAGKSFAATADGQAALARLKAAGLIDTTPPKAQAAQAAPKPSQAPPPGAPAAPAPKPPASTSPLPAAPPAEGEAPRRRGRPPGSKNKPKTLDADVADLI